MIGGRRKLASLAVLLLGMILGPVATGAAVDYRPLDAKGPRLGPDRAELRAGLTCTGNLENAKSTPVLLLSGTTVTPDENFAWNWMPALTEAGYPWCASAPPADPDNMADIQARGEHVVLCDPADASPIGPQDRHLRA